MICVVCSQEFSGRYNQKCCSKECVKIKDKEYNIAKRKPFTKEKVCLECGKVFIATGNAKRCSVECTKLNRQRFNDLNYRKLHTNFENKMEHDKQYYKKNKERILESCNNYYRKVAKEKIQNTKVVVTCIECGKDFEMRLNSSRAASNHTCSKECDSKAKSKRLSGANSWMWKGGITPEHNKIRSSIENREWMIGVFIRDNRVCQICGTHTKKIVAHHIVNFAKLYPDKDPLLFDTANGITMCKNCHDEFHWKYGRVNNDESQIKEFKNERIVI